MVCGKCGRPIEGEPTVCPHCGAPLEKAPAIEEAAVPAEAAPAAEAQEPASQQVSLGAAAGKAAPEKPGKPPKKPLTRKALALRIGLGFLAAVCCLSLLAGGGLLWMRHFIDSHIQPSEPLDSDVDINSSLPTEGVRNIILFGLDSRKDVEKGMSDAMIILSLDSIHNKIKMTSLARDTLVPIEGHGHNKLNAAFSFGGVNLAVKTINRQFGMNIRDYVSVNFYEFAEIVDYVGGVDIDVSRREMGEMNHHIQWIRSYGIPCEPVKKPGMQRLNGGQALAYSRVRKIDSDLERSSRQKEVLHAMFDRVKDLPVSKYAGFIAAVLDICHTNMTADDFMNIATWTVTKGPSFEDKRIPDNADGDLNKAWGGSLRWDNRPSKSWVWVYDLKFATTMIHDFIYETDALPGVKCTKFRPAPDQVNTTGSDITGTQPDATVTGPTGSGITGTGTGSGMTGTQTGSGMTGTQTGSGMTGTGTGSDLPTATGPTGTTAGTGPSGAETTASPVGPTAPTATAPDGPASTAAPPPLP